MEYDIQYADQNRYDKYRQKLKNILIADALRFDNIKSNYFIKSTYQN